MARKMDLLRGDFKFTRNWFRNRNLETFREYVHPEWAGKPITYLELGVFEGMSMVWMLQHVLTHPHARAVGIDPWLVTTKLSSQEMEDVRERAFHNVGLAVLGNRGSIGGISSSSNGTCLLSPKGCLYRANSAELLRRMCSKEGYAGIYPGVLDLCMVDGNHNALAVWDDCRLVYKLLKPGGWMMLDDVENDHPKQDHVKEGLELFRHEVGLCQIELVFKHKYMEVYRKG